MQQKTRHNFGKNEQLFIFVHSNILNFCIKNAIFLLVLDEKNPEFRRCVEKYPNSLKMQKKCKILRNFGAKSGIVAVIHSCRMNNSIDSLLFIVHGNLQLQSTLH